MTDHVVPEADNGIRLGRQLDRVIVRLIPSFEEAPSRALLPPLCRFHHFSRLGIGVRDELP